MGGNVKLERIDGCRVGKGQAFPGDGTARSRAWHPLLESGRLTDLQDQSRGAWTTVLPKAKLASKQGSDKRGLGFPAKRFGLDSQDKRKPLSDLR